MVSVTLDAVTIVTSYKEREREAVPAEADEGSRYC